MQVLNNNLKYQFLSYIYDQIPYVIINLFNLDKSFYLTLLYLLKKERYILTKDEFEFNGSLKSAIKNGYLLKVSKLVENGETSVEVQRMLHANDDYALYLAVKNGYLHIVKYLVQHGADIHAKNNKALRLASENEYLHIFKYLVQQAKTYAEVQRMLYDENKYGLSSAANGGYTHRSSVDA